MTKTKKQKCPPGWDEARVRKLAEHYDNQTDDEAVAEIEAALNDKNQTLMMVPRVGVGDRQAHQKKGPA